MDDGERSQGRGEPVTDPSKLTAEERWGCPECGLGVGADEDGCCSTCGNGCFRTCDPWFTAALASARAEAFEEAALVADAWVAEKDAGVVTGLNTFENACCVVAAVSGRHVAAAIRAKAKEG